MTREEARQVLESVEELNKLPFRVVKDAIAVAIDALKEEEGKKKRWKPKNGEVYWHINTFGQVFTDTWRECDFDEKAYKLGNCYRTKEECEFAIECKLVEQELKDYADEHNEHEIVWDGNTANCTLYYDHIKKEIRIVSYISVQYGVVYFTSREIAEDAIKAIGEERLKKYYLKVVE